MTSKKKPLRGRFSAKESALPASQGNVVGNTPDVCGDHDWDIIDERPCCIDGWVEFSYKCSRCGATKTEVH